MDSIGDLARALVLRTNQVRLRSEMDQLAVEVATGLVKDPGHHLNGDINGLVSIDRSLSRLEAFRTNAAEAALLTGAMQQSLDTIQTRASQVSGTLLTAEMTPTNAMTNTMAGDARATLDQIFGNLNQSVAGRFLFAGSQTDQPPLVSSAAMMDEIIDNVLGAASVAEIKVEVEAYFADDGPFQREIYQGSSEAMSAIPLADEESAVLDFRADNEAVREIIKPLVLAALVGDDRLNLTAGNKVDMLRSAGVDLANAQGDMTAFRARLGAEEARIEASKTRNASETSATQIAKLELIGADPYESASRYENIRMQLEGLYAITARSQRLSLTAFL